MKITEDVRKFAAQNGVEEGKAIEAGLAAKAAEFKRDGELYAPADSDVSAG